MSLTGRELRLQMARNGVVDFSLAYLPHFMTCEPAPIHRRLETANEWALQPGGRLLTGLPREHAKSTLFTIANIIREACLNRGNDHLLEISFNQDASNGMLSTVFAELDSNTMLKQDFGLAIAPKTKSGGVVIKQKQDELILRNDVRIIGRYLNGPIRGLNYLGRRPTTIIMDDPEDDRMQRSPDLLQKAWDWITGALIPAMDVHLGSFLWFGSILSYSSLLRRALHEMPNEQWLKFQEAAIDAKGTPLWPGRWTPELLAARRREVGEKKWWAEYMNDPVDPENQSFKPEYYRSYAREQVEQRGDCWYVIDPRGNERRLETYMMMDLALGQTTKHDWCVIMAIGVDVNPPHWEYGIECMKFRGLPLSELVRKYAGVYQRIKPRRAGVEEVGFQKLVGEALREAGIPVVPVKTSERKDEKIEASALPFEQRKVLLPKDHEGWAEFWRDALQFPSCPQRDLLDTWAMLHQLVVPNHGGGVRTSNRKHQAHSAVSGFIGGQDRAS